MTAALIILACAILNRLSGDARWMGKPEEGDGRGWLPGRPIYYTSVILGLVALALHPWPIALAFGSTYLLWRLPAWGFFFGLGRLKPLDRDPSQYERVLLRISGGNVHLAFTLRHCLMLPLAIVQPWAFAFPVLATAAYEVAWRVKPSKPIIVAEILTGALWGALIVAGEIL
jgi:hypothetical protein